MITVILICLGITIVVVSLCSNPHNNRKPHHDSHKDSFYQQSHRARRNNDRY